MEYVEIILRCLAVYLFLIVGIRVFGKTQLSQLNSADVVLLMLISNAVQNAMVGNNITLQGGLIATVVLFFANYVMKNYVFKNKIVKNLLEEDPQTLVKNGVVDSKILLKEDIDLSELQEAIREHGVEDIDHVKLAVLEIDGTISVISYDQGEVKYTKHKKKKNLRRDF